MDHPHTPLSSPPETETGRAGLLHTRILPPRGLTKLDPHEMWAYRDLLYFLVRREILLRYKQAILGAAWAVLQPLAGMLVFTLLFGRFLKAPSEGFPYPLFVYSGLALWSFFAQSVNESAGSLVANTNLITKVYIPRMMVPLAPALAALIDFAVAGLLLLVLMCVYGVAPGRDLLFLPIPLAIGLLTAWGAGVGLAALNVKYRDFRYVVPFTMNLWFFATPVFYSPSIIPEPWRAVYALNPMVGAVEGVRRAWLGGFGAAWQDICIGAVMALLIFCAGVFYFRKTERFFADVV